MRKNEVPFTGIYEYCYRLWNALLDTELKDDIEFYIPKQYTDLFKPNKKIIQRGIHKFIGVPTDNCRLWHSTCQTSDYMPSSNKIKKVLTLHDLNFLYEKKSNKIKKYLKIVQNHIDKVDHIVAISEFAKNDAIKHLNLRDKPITVIHNGVKVNKYPETGFLTNNGRPFLFAMGTVLPKKNFHVLPCLLKDNDYDLIIAGKKKDSYVEKILQEADKYGVRSRVKIIGPINDHEKFNYLKNCEAFLFPSLAEGFGIPPIEAMLFGKPVFLSTLTSLPEVGGDCAYYFTDFTPGAIIDAFRCGMQHYKSANPSDEIIQHASKFTWDIAASKYVEVYKQLL